MRKQGFQNQSADHAARRSFVGQVRRRREGQARRYDARDTAGRRDPGMERGDARRHRRQHPRQSANHTHGSDRKQRNVRRAERRRAPEIQADLRDRKGTARNRPPRSTGSGCVRDVEIVLSGAAEPVRCAARFVSRRIPRRGLGRSPARHRVGRIRREPNPGLARDRWLQRPGGPVYRCGCDHWAVGVCNRYQHVGGQHLFHRPLRADQQHPVPVRFSAALDDPRQSGICRGLQRGHDDWGEDRLFTDVGSNPHRVLFQRLRHERLYRSGHSDRPQAQNLAQRQCAHLRPAHHRHARHLGDHISRQARLRNESCRSHLAADPRDSEGASR